MKPLPAVSLTLLSVGLALSAATGRADDPGGQPAPPAAPVNPPASPGDGGASAPTPTPAGPRHMRMRPGYVLAELTEKLSLTAEQQKTIGAIIRDGHGQARALRGDDSLSQDDRRAKMRKISASTRDQVRAALTPDQQKLFDAMPPPGPRPKSPDNN
ncbi:MAG TPA: hypothetical protein VKG78_00015 [Opitutaceae bacterium]|nr:hypothetical protein [Opitutaceae bacterium]